MRTLWYCHHYAGAPSIGMSFRPYYLSKSLATKNIDVKVIASAYHHLLMDPRVIDEEVLREDVGGVDYFWLKTPAYLGSGFSRLINSLTYAYRLYKSDLVRDFDLDPPDAIVCSSAHPFHYFAVRRLCKLYGAKCIFEVRDIWPLSLIEIAGVSKFHPMSLILGAIERLAYKTADDVVSLLPYAKLHMVSKGMDETKFSYIPNGVLVQNEEGLVKPYFGAFLDDLRSAGKFVVSYTGAHGVPNCLEQLIYTAKKMQDDGVEIIHFVLVGAGDRKPQLELLAKQLSLSNLSFFSSVAKDQVGYVLASSDVLFIAGQDNPIYKFGISPNKLFDYMLSSKPIILAIDSPGNPVELSDCGRCIKSDDVDLLASTLKLMMSKSEDELSEVGQRGRKFVLENHDYDKLADMYRSII